MPGLWSRTLSIEKGLQIGGSFECVSPPVTMVSFFIKAINMGLGVIVLNPNVNSAKVILTTCFHSRS